MATATAEKLAIKAFRIANPVPESGMTGGERQRTRRKASYQPVFPNQYPKKCTSCKTPDVCEKFVVAGQKRDACIFICPKNTWRPSPANMQKDCKDDNRNNEQKTTLLGHFEDPRMGAQAVDIPRTPVPLASRPEGRTGLPPVFR